MHEATNCVVGEASGGFASGTDAVAAISILQLTRDILNALHIMKLRRLSKAIATQHAVVSANNLGAKELGLAQPMSNSSANDYSS